jgi:ABC-2 type transport system ATP-binding protein
MEKRQAGERSAQVLKRLNLAHAETKPIRTYSKGMKQRLGLALALVHDPEIYILDEPMSGLDPMGRHLITEVIMELRERGKTVFFSSHILSDIERMCNRIGILNKGRLLYCGSVTDFMAYGGTIEDNFIRQIEKDKGQ